MLYRKAVFDLGKILLLALCAASGILAQTVTGVVSGSVVDGTGLFVPGAKITLTNVATSDRMVLESSEQGQFVFSSVLPGAYSITIEKDGFKRFQKTNLNVTQGQRLVAGRLKLELGSVGDSVTVVAQGTPVDVESNERSHLLTGEQLTKLQSRGRNYLALLATLPGTVGDERSFEPDIFGLTLTPSFNGVASTTNSVFVDGGPASGADNAQYSFIQVGMDSVAEVKVLVNNYKAEDGRNGGAIIKTITKSGTQMFHGTGYYFMRNEALNSNYFFNNLNKVARPRYRFNSYGATIGGPIYWPDKFNRTKDKLFFFYSTDRGPTRSPRGLVQVTMPTALERAGDFSQTLDQNNKLVQIIDPQGRTPFPNNVIPANRIDPRGQALLDLFPDANYFDRSVSRGNYNYNFMEVATRAATNDMVKLDYYPTSKLRTFLRVSFWRADDTSYNMGGQQWPMLKATFHERIKTTSFNASYAISPTLVNEINLSARCCSSVSTADEEGLRKLNRDSLGVTLEQLYPGNNPNNFVPALSFGGVPGAAALTPPVNAGLTQFGLNTSVTDSITKIHKSHTIKAGVFFERNRERNPSSGNFNGKIDFARDGNNLLDSNWAYSNALLGVFKTNTETDIHPYYDARGLKLEWYVQDTWKATKRLTVDAGIRFSYFTPFAQANRIGKNFVPEYYDKSKSVVLYRPALNNKVRVAQNPLTGAFAPAAYIGAIVPGSGEVLNGMISASDPDCPSGFIENRGVHYGPRLGLAYDLTGDGKTALRGGIGVSYQVHSGLGGPVAAVNNLQNSPTFYYGTIDTLDSAQSILFPRTVTSVRLATKTPTIYSYSFGLQREVEAGTVVDVAYVATLGRQLASRQTGVNGIAPGSRFLPENLDYNGKSPVADDFFRPYVGYTNITLPQSVTSNYHSLQVSANRRFAKGMQFGASWTWSKSMGYYEPYATYYNNALNYGKTNLDRTHSLVLTYLYDVPKASKIVDVAPVRWMFDNWQLSGTTSFTSGRPWPVNYSLTYSQDLLGGGDYNRVIVKDVATLAHGDRTFSRFFNTGAFAPPSSSALPGNAPMDVFRGPGRNNWDVSLQKIIPMRERTTLQFRCELYNAFNHASFNAVDNGARFDNLGNQVNTRFGQLTGSLTPRIMQLALRLSF